MRENRTYGSEGGEPVMDNFPTLSFFTWIADLRICVYINKPRGRHKSFLLHQFLTHFFAYIALCTKSGDARELFYR